MNKKLFLEVKSKKYKNICATLSCIEHLLILTSKVTGCYCEFYSNNKNLCNNFENYKVQVMKKKHDKIALLTKTKLNSVKAWISKALIHSHIRHNEFVSINDVLKEYVDINQKSKI